MIKLSRIYTLNEWHYFKEIDGSHAIRIESIGDGIECQEDSLVFIDDLKQIKGWNKPAGCLVVDQKNAEWVPKGYQFVVVRGVRKVMQSFLSDIARDQSMQLDQLSQSIVSESAQLAQGVTIGQGSTIGDDVVLGQNVYVGRNCHLAKGVIIGANVVIEDNVCIGEGSVIKANAVIGSRGFGFVPDQEKWLPIAHLAGVTIGERVHIGSCTTVDAGILRPTAIHSDVIIDNLCQVAHNVMIGQGTAIAGCSGIAGSTHIGMRCQIGGGCGIGGHLTIASDVIIQGGSNVLLSIKKSGIYSNVFPVSILDTWRSRLRGFIRLGHKKGVKIT